MKLLAIVRDFGRIRRAAHPQLDVAFRGNHHRPGIQAVRSHWGYQHHLSFRQHNRAAGGKRIGSGTGGRGHNQPIAFHLHGQSAVNPNVYINHPADVAVVNHNIILGNPLGNLLAVAPNPAINLHSRLQKIFALHQSQQIMRHTLRL